MCRSVILATLIFSALCLPLLAAAQSDLSRLDFAAGKALFDRNWVPAPASTRSADGLGPHYATRSCAACHEGGGRGVAPQAFTLHVNDPAYGLRLTGFSTAGVPPEVKIEWQSNPEGERAWELLMTGFTHGELSSRVSARLAPSLRGLGLLEAVPQSVLERIADPEDEDGDGISGRLAHLADGRVGRFGWKAAASSLEEQLQLALALDLGLGNPGFPDLWGDCTAAQVECRAQADATADPDHPLEADETVTGLLLAYLRQLPPPAQLAQIDEGEAVLQELGCAACHVPTLSTASGEVRAYTDLLLHDLGPDLDDGLAEGAAQSHEWRTAPLWDLSVEGPFLHDGRARTLNEAVEWHGGEAAGSRDAYRRLNKERKAILSTFLLGL